MKFLRNWVGVLSLGTLRRNFFSVVIFGILSFILESRQFFRELDVFLERISCYWLIIVSFISKMKAEARSLKLFLQYLFRVKVEFFKVGFLYIRVSGAVKFGSKNWILLWKVFISMIVNIQQIIQDGIGYQWVFGVVVKG